MEVFQEMAAMGHERVLFCSSPEVGLRAIIAVHSTVLGPGLGGVRMWPYATIDEALRCKQEGVSRTILFNLCGHGYFDMAAYDQYLSGAMVDYELPQEEIQRALHDLEGLPKVGASAR